MYKIYEIRIDEETNETKFFLSELNGLYYAFETSEEAWSYIDNNGKAFVTYTVIQQKRISF